MFLLLFSDKCTQDVSKYFVYKWWVGEKPAFRKIVLKNFKKICEDSFAKYTPKQLFTSVSVNAVAAQNVFVV